MRFNSIVLLWVLASLLIAQPHSTDFQEIADSFEKKYVQLNIPYISLRYAENLENVGSKKELDQQEAFFLDYQKTLQPYLNRPLTRDERLTLDVLLYEIELHLERISLESKWNAGGYRIQGERIYDEPLGKEWYAYFLKNWVDKDFTPDAAYDFGLEEIEKVKRRMAELKPALQLEQEKQSSAASDYLVRDEEMIIEKYYALNRKVIDNAKNYFPYMDDIPAIQIVKGSNPALAIVPAYYWDNTFYFNFFEDAYDRRDMGWVLVHEATPGHHYHNYVNQQTGNSLRNEFLYMGYLEGWGAYVEQFGEVLGAYNSPSDTYAQLEWDLIRSVRVSLDVALNYYGWSDEKAHAFWEEHIKDKPAIAQREITRMKRQPAQVITYKYGKQLLDELKGDRMTPEALKVFHQQVLEDGNLPLSVLKKNVLQKQAQQAEK
ncbi:MAG: DUF885 family protein [Saprospiraceae bacterium]|nr:DUF885 family protein [Saprospiraceae bacterium]